LKYLGPRFKTRIANDSREWRSQVHLGRSALWDNVLFTLFRLFEGLHENLTEFGEQGDLSDLTIHMVFGFRGVDQHPAAIPVNVLPLGEKQLR
jgi:hypothetical protein